MGDIMIENIKWLFETTSIHTIILNIISSLIFGIVIWSTKNIWFDKLSDAIIKRYFLTINDIKILPDKKRTHKLINKEINSSNSICILAMLGQRTFEIYPTIWSDKNKKIEIVLSNINNEAFKDYNSLHIANTVHVINEFIQNKKRDYPNLKFYTHNIDLPFYMIILDESIYIKHLNVSRQFNTLNVSRYGKESDEFYSFKKYYKSIKMSAYEE